MLVEGFLCQKGWNGKCLGCGAWMPSLFAQLSPWKQWRLLLKIQDLWLCSQVTTFGAFSCGILVVCFVTAVKQPNNFTLTENYFCLLLYDSKILPDNYLTLSYQKHALVMQTTNLPVCNFSDCVKKIIKRDKLGREMMLLKYELYPTWLVSLPCLPCARLGTGPAGKGSFAKCGRNFSEWGAGPRGIGVRVGASRGMVVAGLQRPAPTMKQLRVLLPTAKGSC